MSKLFGRIKYHFLRRLLDDICRRSECYEGGCRLCGEVVLDCCDADPATIACFEEDVFMQARKVWGLDG